MMKKDDFEGRFSRGISLYNDRRYLEAAQSFEQASALRPADAAVLALLARSYAYAGQAQRAMKVLTRGLDRCSDRDPLYLTLGEFFLQAKKFEAARASFLRLKPDSPHAAQGLFLLGKTCLKLGQTEKGEAWLRRSIKLGGYYEAEACKLLGALLEKQSLSEALLFYQQACRKASGDAGAWFCCGAALFRLERYEEAVACLQKAVELNGSPDAARMLVSALEYLGLKMQSRGFLNKAEARLRSVLGLDPGRTELAKSLGSVLEMMGKLQEAELFFDRTPASDDGGIYVSLGKLYRANGQTRRAANCFAKAIERLSSRTDSVDVRLSLTEVHVLRGFYHEAGACLVSAAHIDPRLYSASLRPAEIYCALGDSQSALRHVRQVVRLSPNLIEAHNLKSALLCELGRRSEALRSVRTALRRGGGSASQCYSAGGFFIKLGEFQAAEACLRKAVRSPSKSARACAGLGRLKLWSGDYRGAVGWARRAVVRDAASTQAMMIIGAAKVMRRRYQDSLAYLNKAVKLDPRNYEAYIWRSEAKTRLRRHRQAWRDIGVAASFLGNSISVWAVRSMIMLEWGNDATKLQGNLEQTFIIAKRHGLLADSFKNPPHDHPGRPREAVEKLLARLAGNRSSMPTRVRPNKAGPRLALCPNPRNLRFLCSRVQSRIRYLSDEGVIKEFQGLMRRYPGSALPYLFRGELQLWMGRYSQAAEDFHRVGAMSDQRHWWRVGLCAVELMRGDFTKALGWCEEFLKFGSTLGSMYAYRGEVYRRLGRLTEARADLLAALELNPQRLGAWINLALTRGELGDLGGQGEILLRLRKDWSNLIHDAESETRVFLPEAVGEKPPSPEAAGRLLEKCLEMLRGNRSSSWHTYFNGAGQMKILELGTGTSRPG